MAKNEIRLKRAYEKPDKDDGYRILVDRLWPRGVSKDEAAIDLWLKDVAPSDALRKRYHGGSGNWEDFRKRYRKELDGARDALGKLLERLDEKTVTLVYSSKDAQHNNAVVLKEYVGRMFMRRSYSPESSRNLARPP